MSAEDEVLFKLLLRDHAKNAYAHRMALFVPGWLCFGSHKPSMVLLDAARRQVAAPRLARWLLAAGISATLAANVAAGLHFGPVGAVVAAWPALALVGSYELLMLIIRSEARADTSEVRFPSAINRPAGGEISQPDIAPETVSAPDTSADTPDPVTVRAQLNGTRKAVERAFSADIEAGRVPGLRRIQGALHVGAPKARTVQEAIRNTISERNQ